MRIVLTLAVVLLAGCSNPFEIPIIDMTGVDPGQESRDMADCYAHPKAWSNLEGYIGKCMTARGYKVLVGMPYGYKP